MDMMKATCKRGHALTTENVYTYRGKRQCKLCSKSRREEYKQRYGAWSRPKVEAVLRDRYEVLPNGCWQWTGVIDRNGYGRVTLAERNYMAHRIAFELHYGKVLGKEQVRNTCGNRSCVNPDHLVSGFCSEFEREEKCPRGHPLSEDNLYVHRGARFCKICGRERVRAFKLAAKYGLSTEDYEALVLSQQGLCAICKKPQDVTTVSGKNAEYLDVDHDHVTGKVRALLCRRCNSALGFIDDDIERAKAIVAYLSKWKEE